MSPDTRSRNSLFATSLLAIVVGCLAITQQSLWMDEGSTVFRALMPTFQDWKQMMFRLGGSDVQMPFYMLLVWGWVKLGFLSEYGLRLINLPFLVLMVLALRKVRFWPLVCLISPFVLFYVGELRPYSMQMAASAIAAAGLGDLIAARKNNQEGFKGIHLIAGGALMLIASSLTAAVWAAGLAVGTLVVMPGWLLKKGFWQRVLPWTLAGGAIIGYYAYTIHQGYRAASTGGGSLLSIGFGFYEMSGMMGLGPSRDEMRASPLSLISQLSWLLPAIACVAGAWCLGLREWMGRSDKRAWIAVGLTVVSPLVVLGVVGVVADFRVLGRHMSPAIPAALLPLAVFVESSLHKSFPTKVLASATIIVLLTSSLILRFHPKHFRDDYRTITDIALEAIAKGQRIHWQADMNATRYYAYRKGGMPLVNAVQQLESDQPGLVFADLVVINRPDNRYKGFNYRRDLEQHDFTPLRTLTGFEIWKNRY